MSNLPFTALNGYQPTPTLLPFNPLSPLSIPLAQIFQNDNNSPTQPFFHHRPVLPNPFDFWMKLTEMRRQNSAFLSCAAAVEAQDDGPSFGTNLVEFFRGLRNGVVRFIDPGNKAFKQQQQ